MISIEIHGDKELLAKMKKLERANPAKAICKEMAQFLVFNLKSRVPFWTGNLMKSIQSRMTIDGYNIQMESYAEGLEFGHGPVEVNPLIIAWAFEKSRAPFKAIETLVTVGAKKHPFIQPSIDAVMKELEPTSMSVLNRTLKESGFR